MASVKTDDPYFYRARITHDAVTAADSGNPVTAQIFEPQLGCNILKIRAYIAAGTATIALLEYAGKLSEKLNSESWVQTASQDLDAATNTLVGFPFVTGGARCAIKVTAHSGAGALTIEAVRGANDVADK